MSDLRTPPSRNTHHLEDAAPVRRGPSTRTSIAIPAIVGLVIGTVFVTIFLAAFHAPEPHDLPIGIVGSAEQIASVEQALDENAPGAIAFTVYDSADDAVAAIEHRTVYGAYVMSEDGTTARLLYAGANGPAVTSTLEGAFGSVAQYSGATLDTEDIVPTSAGDTRSLSIFYAGFGIVLAGYLFGLISSQMAPRLQLRWRLLSLAVFSVVVGSVVAFIAGSTGFDALPGNVAAILAVTVLLAASVGSATLMLMRIGGPVGTLLASLVLLILGNATGGGTLPPAYLPDWLRPLSEILPVGIGLRALQGESYFQGDGYVLGIVLLAVWTLASIGVVVALDVLAARRTSRALRRAAHSPAA